jgi:hypothetical protein
MKIILPSSYKYSSSIDYTCERGCKAFIVDVTLSKPDVPGSRCLAPKLA